MLENEVVRARINGQVKAQASAVLAAMGLTVSDAFRMLLTRVAVEKELPFSPLTPNQETIDAIKDARRGAMTSVRSKKALFARLNEDAD